MRSVLAGLAVLAIAGTASAGTIRVPQDHPTIQGAVDAAAEGDTIQVSKGTYVENVVVAKRDLKLVGKKAVIDGTLVDVDGDCLTVNADGVLVQGFEFRNGLRHIVFAGASLDVEKCVFLDSAGDAVSGTGDWLQIVKCRFEGAGGSAADVAGASVLFAKNAILQCGETGVLIAGPDARVERNTVSGVGGGDGIGITGLGARVLKNRVEGASAGGIAVDGDAALVDVNTVSWTAASAGIRVNGTGALVRKSRLTAVAGGILVTGDAAGVFGNRISSSVGGVGIEVHADDVAVAGNVVSVTVDDAYGIFVTSSTEVGGGYVEGNIVEDASDCGFYLPGIHDVTLRSNAAVRCGAEDEAGFVISGNENYIHDNRAVECDNSGFVLSGDLNVVERCHASSSGGNGFLVAGAQNTFTACTAKDCGDGFDNGGTDTRIQSGSFKGNRLDIGNRVAAGATILLLSVKYDTGGATTEPVID